MRILLKRTDLEHGVLRQFAMAEAQISASKKLTLKDGYTYQYHLNSLWTDIKSAPDFFDVPSGARSMNGNINGFIAAVQIGVFPILSMF